MCHCICWGLHYESWRSGLGNTKLASELCLGNTPFTSVCWSRLVLWSIISERLHCACIVWVDAERRRSGNKNWSSLGELLLRVSLEHPRGMAPPPPPSPRSPTQKHISIRRWSALDIFCLWKTEDGSSEHVLKKKKNSYSISLRRYGWTPDSLHSHCPDGNAFTVERALSCPRGGYIALHVEAQWDQGRLGWAHARDLLQLQRRRHYRSRAPATQWGSNHDERMEALLQQCEEQHTVLNTSEEKLIVKAKELPYMGYVFSSDGLKTDPGKVRAIQRMPEPKDAQAVRRFIGMATYLAKFIPNMSDLTAPVQKFVKVDSEKIEWNELQRRAFNDVKKGDCPIICFEVLWPVGTNCRAMRCVIHMPGSGTFAGRTACHFC